MAIRTGKLLPKGSHAKLGKRTRKPLSPRKRGK